MSKTLEHPPNVNPARPGHWRSLIAGFGLIIVAVQIIPKFLPAPFLYENRVLAGLPQLSKSGRSLTTYFDELDKYLRDQFPARSRLIASVNWVRFKLGYSHSDRVIVGKDGWLFHDDGLHLSFYRGRRLSETELAAIAKGFGDRTRQIAAAGSHFYALFPPYKPGIYPEKLPSGFQPLPRISELDQIKATLEAAGFDNMVDVRPTLLADKKTVPTYVPGDTHWRSIGAYKAYWVLMSRIAKDLPDLAPFGLEAFERTVRPLSSVPRNLEGMLGVWGAVAEFDREHWEPPQRPGRTITYLTERTGWDAPQVITTGYNTRRTALLVHDSFAIELLPFFERHFERIIVVHFQDDKKFMWFDPALLDRFKPDVVILEAQEQGAGSVLAPLQESCQSGAFCAGKN